MSMFSLIKQLNDVDDTKKTTLAKGVPYQQYDIMVDGVEQCVNIPLKEAANFEKQVEKLTTEMTRQALKVLLRNHRGLRERGSE